MVMTELIPKQLADMVAERDTLLAQYKEIRITDALALKDSVSALKLVSDFRKRVEDIAKQAEKPHKDEIARIKESKEFVLGECTSVENHIRTEQRNFFNAQEVARIKEQERQNKLADNRAARAEEKGIVRPLSEVVAPIVQGAPRTIEGDNGSKLSQRTDWKAERIPGQEGKIPIEYFMSEDIYQRIDIKVSAVARSTKGAVQVPGYRIFSVQTPVMS